MLRTTPNSTDTSHVACLIAWQVWLVFYALTRAATVKHDTLLCRVAMDRFNGWVEPWRVARLKTGLLAWVNSALGDAHVVRLGHVCAC